MQTAKQEMTFKEDIADNFVWFDRRLQIQNVIYLFNCHTVKLVLCVSSREEIEKDSICPLGGSSQNIGHGDFWQGCKAVLAYRLMLSICLSGVNILIDLCV